jgi:hypothetical protein
MGPLRSLLAVTVAMVGLAAASCNEVGPPLDSDAGAWWTGLRRLTVEPAEVTLQGGPGMRPTQQFRVIAELMDGSRRDATRSVTYELNPSGIGAMRNDGLFTSSGLGGGIARLTVRPARAANSMSADAQITVRWTATSNVGMGVPGDVATQFASGQANGDMAAAPRVVYPYNNTLMPPNIASLELHWQPGAGAGAGTLYDVAFSNTITDVHLYTSCQTMGSGCVYAFTPETWHWVAETNRGASPVEIRVRSLTGGRVSTSAVSQIRFAATDIRGGIYYWTATSNTNGIYRYDFSAGDSAPQEFYTQRMTPGQVCVGCHALSLDGTRTVIVLGGAHVGNGQLLDVANRQVLASKLDRWAQLISFDPQGQRLVAARDGELRLVNGMSLDDVGARLETGGLATHPEWSPANNGIAFSQPMSQNNAVYIRRAAIGWLPATGGMFGPPQILVPAAQGQNNYYPSATPDGRYLVYNRSTCPGGTEPGGTGGSGAEPADECNSYDDPTARLFITNIDGTSHQQVELAAANAHGPTDMGDDLTNSWPRVSPFTTTVEGGRVYWVTFSTRRLHGVRPAEHTSDGRLQPQVWMVGIRVPSGEVTEPLSADPSFAPFWLPFQDRTQGNHIAQWTQTVVPFPG